MISLDLVEKTSKVASVGSFGIHKGCKFDMQCHVI